jgi:hypothetical protein
MSLQLVPVINFISLLAQYNDSARHAALEEGFLDMLLRIYVIFPTFHMSTAESTADKRSRRKALLDVCRSALDVLSVESHYSDMVFNHPVYHLWLRCHELVPSYVVWTPEDALDARCAAWRRVEVDIIKRRLMTIWCLASTMEMRDRNSEIWACMDIVEFSRCILRFSSPDNCI